jgi:proteasome activator subunit 4
VLQFITPVRAHALMVLPRNADTALQALVESRLDDRQIEVQEVAAETLIGFIMTLPRRLRAALAQRFLALAASKLPKKVAAPPNMTAASAEELEAFRSYKTKHARAVRKRHAGCLGVAAVVRAHPFDVPPWLPAVLSALARHVSDPVPIPATVRRTLDEFKRTHQDNWDAHKAAFTDAEMMDVTGVTSGGNYFA